MPPRWRSLSVRKSAAASPSSTRRRRCCRRSPRRAEEEARAERDRRYSELPTAKPSPARSAASPITARSSTSAASTGCCTSAKSAGRASRSPPTSSLSARRSTSRSSRPTEKTVKPLAQPEAAPARSVGRGRRKYTVGERVSGGSRAPTDFGAFVELEPGIEGLIHLSEISWTKKRVTDDV